MTRNSTLLYCKDPFKIRSQKLNDVFPFIFQSCFGVDFQLFLRNYAKQNFVSSTVKSLAPSLEGEKANILEAAECGKKWRKIYRFWNWNLYDRERPKSPLSLHPCTLPIAHFCFGHLFLFALISSIFLLLYLLFCNKGAKCLQGPRLVVGKLFAKMCWSYTL